MSGLDASFLYFETPSMHMHVVGTLVLDPSTSPEGFSLESVRRTVRERLHLIEPFRRRVHFPTMRLTHPSWVETDVDVDRHVTVVQCPAPGTMDAFCRVAGEFAGRRLDRDRPLWEALLVEGLANGRVGLLIKVHHCAVDGVGAANVLQSLFDLSPAGRTAEELRGEPRQVTAPGMSRRMATTATALVRRPLNVARVVPPAVQAVAGVARARIQRGGASGAPTPFSNPRAPFNGRITPRRAVALVDVPLSDVKAARGAAEGTTFNDVVIAVVGSALRQYLTGRDQLPEGSLLAVCPVSVREGETGGGNQTSAFFAALGTDVADPVERLRAVHVSTSAAKSEHEAVGGDLLQRAAELAPPSVTTAVARLYSAVRLAELHPTPLNLVLSNVPGPPVRLYLAGAAVEQIYPLGPVLEGFGLNITVASYVDRVGFGFVACAERMPDLPDLAAAVPGGLAELLAAAEAAAS